MDHDVGWDSSIRGLMFLLVLESTALSELVYDTEHWLSKQARPFIERASENAGIENGRHSLLKNGSSGL
jgi:hypothetical protein